MRATIVYIYLCDCIGVFECEAHFNMIIVPASVWGYEVMEGFTCFTVRRVFVVSFGREGTGDCDSGSASESVGSVQSRRGTGHGVI